MRWVNAHVSHKYGGPRLVFAGARHQYLDEHGKPTAPVINYTNTPFDLKSVLQTLVESAGRLCGAADEQRQIVEKASGFGLSHEDIASPSSHRPGDAALGISS